MIESIIAVLIATSILVAANGLLVAVAAIRIDS